MGSADDFHWNIAKLDLLINLRVAVLWKEPCGEINEGLQVFLVEEVRTMLEEGETGRQLESLSDLLQSEDALHLIFCPLGATEQDAATSMSRWMTLTPMVIWTLLGSGTLECHPSAAGSQWKAYFFARLPYHVFLLFKAAESLQHVLDFLLVCQKGEHSVVVCVGEAK